MSTYKKSAKKNSGNTTNSLNVVNSSNSGNSSNIVHKKSKKNVKEVNTNVNNRNNANANDVNNKIKGDSHNDVLTKVIKRMLESIHAIKLYHWNTKSYATHKATDGLHEKLGELVDHYVEVFIGKIDTRLKMSDYKELTIQNLTTNKEMEKFIIDLINFLMTVHTKLDINKDTDLLNIRDEIAGELNQFLYLLRLN